MKPTKELVKLTLSDLKGKLLSYQIELKTTQWEKHEIQHALAICKKEETKFRVLIKNITNKIKWEMDRYHNLLGFTPINGQQNDQIDPNDLDGEEWKNQS